MFRSKVVMMRWTAGLLCSVVTAAIWFLATSILAYLLMLSYCSLILCYWYCWRLVRSHGGTFSNTDFMSVVSLNLGRSRVEISTLPILMASDSLLGVLSKAWPILDVCLQLALGPGRRGWAVLVRSSYTLLSARAADAAADDSGIDYV